MAPTSGTTPGSSPTGDSGLDATTGIGLVVVASLGLLVLVAAARGRRTAAFEPASAELMGEVALELPAPPIRSFIPPPAPTGEEHVPRWRRPSVTAARFETDASVAVRAASAPSIAPARTARVFAEQIDDVVERMMVRYDSVPLLDRPDEVLGRTQEMLDQGDEVGVLERDEVWANVTTPTGLAGWIPAMALAAPAPAPATAATSEESLEPPVAIEPDRALAPHDRLGLDAILEAIAAARREGEEEPHDSTGNGEDPAGSRESFGVHSPSSARQRRKHRSVTRPN